MQTRIYLRRLRLIDVRSLNFEIKLIVLSRFFLTFINRI